MQSFDRSKPFGKITPAMDVDGCDNPAVYEQDGMLFDAHGMPCVPGGAAARTMVPPTPPAAMAQEPTMSVDALIAGAESMPYTRLLKHAKEILGPSCPGGGKQPIIDALVAAKAEYEARKAKKMTASAARPASEEPAPAPSADQAPLPPTPPMPIAAPSAAVKPGVDLAAWGRGQKDYLFGEVQKAVRQQYHAQLSERRDVVDLLVQQGVITSAQARQDV